MGPSRPFRLRLRLVIAMLLCASVADAKPPVIIQQRKVKAPKVVPVADEEESEADGDDDDGPGARPTRRPRRDDPDDVPTGMSQRQSRLFRIVYNGPVRDFAEKAHYEQQVLDSFERAAGQVRSILGRARDGSVDVVLYTSQEFRFHFGGRFEQGVLGFYEGRIRMNLSERIDGRFHATAVHEYVHAVIDDLANGRMVPHWVHEGLARWVERKATGGIAANFGERQMLKAMAAEGRLPTFDQLTRTGFINLGGATGAAYAKSALGVERLAAGGGPYRLLEAIEEVGRGVPFDRAFQNQFGPGRLASLDGEVEKQLGTK